MRIVSGLYTYLVIFKIEIICMKHTVRLWDSVAFMWLVDLSCSLYGAGIDF
jgi:hypothetical protein